MHEFSVAQSIVETVLRVAQEHGARQVLEVNLEIGEVALVNVDQLQWHIGMLVEGTLAENMGVRVTKVPAKIHCLACDYGGAAQYRPQESTGAHGIISSFACPKCNSNETIIKAGRELRVIDINARFDDAQEEEKERDA